MAGRAAKRTPNSQHGGRQRRHRKAGEGRDASSRGKASAGGEIKEVKWKTLFRHGASYSMARNRLAGLADFKCCM